jgi:hypothetical protein
MNKKTMRIIDLILTVASYSLAFWVDWRVGLALFAFDLSRVFEVIAE